MSDPLTYLAEIELVLVSSPAIAEYQVIRSWNHTDDGYIRIQARLTNGDFIEAAEYFVCQQDDVKTVDYHHQWMDRDRTTLRRRWDSTPHHPELENFPFHVHLEDSTFIPGLPMSLIALLEVLAGEV